MCKKLCLLIVVLLVGVCNLAWGDAIDVNNYSFELAPDGNKVPGHTGYGGVLAWNDNHPPAQGFVGVDVMCPYANSNHCHSWPGPTETGSGTDIVYSYLEHRNSNAWQVLDMNNSDANAVIVEGRQYTLTFDGMGWGDTIAATLFYPEDVCVPDANHVEIARKEFTFYARERPLGDCSPTGMDDDPTTVCPDWTYDRKLVFVSYAGEAYLGKTLGIKIIAMVPGGYSFIDNIRLDWNYATYAWEPYPEDEAENVERDLTLTWKPGGYTQSVGGHEVYFGTDETAVTDANTNSPEFEAAVDSNSKTISGALDLGQMYYWRVDQVNETYAGSEPPTPANGRWKGPVWSFEVAGYALDPDPEDDAVDVPFLDTVLSWTAGTDALTHDVYFGTDEDAVADANTNSSFEFRANQVIGNTDWPLPTVTVGKTYYWRIDEVNTTSGTLVKGKIWSFTIGPFLIVDDFDSYNNMPDLFAVWDDYWVNGSDGQIALETGDVNISRSGHSMELDFLNTTQGGSGGNKYYIGSWTDAQDMTKLEVGSDWTIGGVKALQLFIMGDPCNIHSMYTGPDWGAAWPWVELEDTSSNIGFVKLDDPNDVLKASWYEWNIDLADFDACGVTLSAIDRVAIGVGGVRTGQNKASPDSGHIYIEDIRLYPPRCVPEIGLLPGDLDEDCGVAGSDLKIMAEDWLAADGCFPTSQQNAAITMKAGDPNWTTGHINNALGFDPNIQVDVGNPGLMGLTNMSITLWAKRNGVQEGYVGLVTCREDGLEDSTELAGGKDGDSVGYCWNQVAKTWQFSSGLVIPDGQWTLMAMAVDPTGATLYAGPAGGTLVASPRHAIELEPLKQFGEPYWIGRGRADERYYIGAIDDVRIYDKTLDASEMTWLHTGGGDGNDPGCPAYHYELDESSGLTAADDGCGAIVYRPVMSPANLTDPEPMNERFVNFRDFDIMADDWLEQKLWPEW